MTNPVPESSPPATQVATYISRPVSIEAVQWDGTEEHARQLCDWADSYRGRGSACFIAGQEPIEMSYQLEGKPVLLERPARIAIGLRRDLGGMASGQADMRRGDWLIKGVEDEFYPCPDTVFQTKYRKHPGLTGMMRQHILVQNGQDVG